MAELSFASPAGALVVVGVALPIAAALVVERRGVRVRRALGLDPPGGRPFVAPLVAVGLLAALVAAAAAQPLLATTDRRFVRADLEVYLVLDTSRSMRAASSADAPTRFERARRAAHELRSELADVPVGVASLTDRLLVHAFPTTANIRATLDRALGVERPPPLRTGRHATNFAALADAVIWNFFSERVDHRVLVVLTDGEGRRDDARVLRDALSGQPRFEAAFVHVWNEGEQVFGPSGPERAYRADPGSRGLLEQVARVVRGTVFDESDVGRVSEWVRSRSTARRREAATVPAPPRRLAPYALGAAFLPLSFLLWRRNGP